MITRLFGFCGMVSCLLVVYYFETSSGATGVLRILHWPALVLTGLGPVTLIFISFDAGAVFKMFGKMLGMSASKQKKRAFEEAVYLHRLGKRYYEEGPVVFEAAKTDKLSGFVANVVDRLSLRMPMEDINELALIDKDKMEMDLIASINVASNAVKLTPSIGMLGTIMGMVNLLSTLEDPSHIGSHMSLALLTTFFGLFFSIVLWTPVQQKLEKLLTIEMNRCVQTLRWLDLLERRKPYFADTTEFNLEGKGKAA